MRKSDVKPRSFPAHAARMRHAGPMTARKPEPCWLADWRDELSEMSAEERDAFADFCRDVTEEE